MIELFPSCRDWPRETLGNLCDIKGGFPAPQDDAAFEGGQVPFVRMKDVGRHHFTNNLYETDAALNQSHFNNGRYEITPRGSILMPRSGSVALNHRAILGIDAVIVSHLCALVPKSKIIATDFLYRFLCMVDMRKLTKKTTGLDSIAFSDLRLVAIPVPPPPEQKRIAEVLDRAEALRAKRRAALAQLDTLTQSIFLDLFGDPLTNSKKWPKKELSGACTNITDGTHDTPDRSSSGVPFITSKNIRPFQIDLCQLDYVSSEVHQELKKRCYPKPGDILYTNIGVNVGNAVANRLDFEFSLKNVALLQPDDKQFNSYFLESLLNYVPFKKSILDASSTGGAQKFISLTVLRKLIVPVPALTRQVEFARRAATVEKLKAAHRQSVAELDALFASLQHRAFRGEL
jgi:type I restriction enzyme S subunit